MFLLEIHQFVILVDEGAKLVPSGSAGLFSAVRDSSSAAMVPSRSAFVSSLAPIEASI